MNDMSSFSHLSFTSTEKKQACTGFTSKEVMAAIETRKEGQDRQTSRKKIPAAKINA